VSRQNPKPSQAYPNPNPDPKPNLDEDERLEGYQGVDEGEDAPAAVLWPAQPRAQLGEPAWEGWG